MLFLPTLFSLLTITTTTAALNPQPLPPGHHISPAGERDLNPQPLPPGRKIPIYERDSCAPSYVKCAPPGATGTSIPVIGSAVKGLYLNVLQSVQGDKLGVKKRDLILDPAGFPNGRRVFDDVVTIELHAIAGATLPLSERDMVERPETMKRQPPLSTTDSGGLDYFDVSLVDGDNIPLQIVPGSVAGAGAVDMKVPKTDMLNTVGSAADIKDLLGKVSIEADGDHLQTLSEELDVPGEVLQFLGVRDQSLAKSPMVEESEMVKRRSKFEGFLDPSGSDVVVDGTIPRPGKRATTVQMCCAAGTQCLLLKDFNVPFCWDKFTTNFFLPFSSYGSLLTGNYTSPAPPSAPANTPSDVNLLSGNYTSPDGSSGNIYSDDEAAKPNTATLGSLMPTPWTSTGVGSAIPASALGGIATWTTVIEGITVEPTVVSGSTVAGKTIAPVTTTVTGFEETASSTAAANSTSSKGVASGGHGAEEWATRMAVAVAGMLCAVMGL